MMLQSHSFCVLSYTGTGLGLSITSKLVHRLGGTISLKSDYGKYAEFTVDLPFRGIQVNMPGLRQRLQETTIVLVQPDDCYDYGLDGSMLELEPDPFQPEMVEALDLDLLKFNSLGDAYDELSKGDTVNPGKTCVLLVHEDLYQPQLFQRVEELDCCRDCTLMTYGPNYSIEMTKDQHFKSLGGIFPSSLMEKIAAHLEKRKKATVLPNQQHPVQTCGLFSGLPAARSPESQRLQTGDLFAGLPGHGQVATITAQTSTGGLFAGLQSSSTGGLFSGLNNSISTPAGPGANEPKGLIATVESNQQEDTVKGATTRGLFAAVDSGSLPTGAPTVSTIPATNSTSSIPQGKLGKAVVRQRDVKVLLAEDNIVNQKVLSRVLVRSGISDITIVDNGQKAVDICDTTKFDIIFMDVQMPASSIYVCCARLDMVRYFAAF